MLGGDVKIAVASLRRSKWRSGLAMFGIIIGIVSVVTIVSLGEGMKKQIVGQINRLGNDLITVRPGKVVSRDNKGNITKVNIASNVGFGAGSLSERDYDVIKNTPDIGIAVPISLVSANARIDDRQYDSGYIIGTNQDLPSAFSQKITYGTFFTSNESKKRVAIVGRTVAEEFFQENVPTGMTFNIHGQEFVVRGVFDKFETSPLGLSPDYNRAIFIPYEVGRDLTGGNSQLNQVLVRPKDPSQTGTLISSLNARLLDSHDKQNDFTILKQDENLAVTSDILNLLTGFIAGIAAISLIVGGVGIMNIMLVAVTERTREIGIRKAVGATNHQILRQFMIEATVLSVVGGVAGIILSLICNYTIRVSTDLQPAITWQIFLLATGISLIIGVIFGIAPAAKAASRDPIEALRYE